MNGPHIQFFGTLTRDPEQCFSQDEGIPYARLWVAVRTRYDDKQPPDTQDFEVYLWGYHMDTAVAHCRKGQQVYVFGRLSGREHHRADDTRGLAHVVNAKEFHFFPAEEGDPPEPDPGHQRGASGPRVLGRRDRSGSPAGDGPAAPGHITHGPAGRASNPA